MADAVYVSDAVSNFLLNSLVNKEEYTCGNCRDRENKMKEALNKLRLAQTIISILQNELILTSTTTCTVNRPHSNIEVWKLAAYNNIVKSQRRAKSVRSERAAYSYSVSTANRFSPLSYLESCEYVPTQRIHKTTNIRSKCNKHPDNSYWNLCVPSELQCTTFKQEETTHTKSHQSKVKKTQFVKSLNEVKHKILLIGDSHARNRAHLLQDNLNSDFNSDIKVSSFVKPGARMNEVINTVREELTLNSDLLVVVWGGINDIRNNNTKEALNSVSKFVNENN
jgi:hypothetical protein